MQTEMQTQDESDFFAGTLPPPSTVDRYAMVPKELKTLRNWVVFRLVPTTADNDSKLTKVPYIAGLPLADARKASTTDRSTWKTFHEAVSSQLDGYDGIGFVFTDSGYAGIDLDHCRNVQTGAVDAWAQNIIDDLNSYAELSPSETGVHVITKLAGRPFPGIKRGLAEMYCNGRFFTMTGKCIGVPRITAPKLAPLYQRIEAREFVFGERAQSHHSKTAVKDSVAVEYSGSKLVPTSKLKILTAGEIVSTRPFVITDGMGASVEYPSQSEADQALCNLLALDGADVEEIDMQFRASSLMRSKWADRADYRDATIKRAIQYRDREKTKQNQITLTEQDQQTLMASDTSDRPSENVDSLGELDLTVTPTHRGIAEVIAKIFGRNYLYAIGEVKGTWWRYNGQIWRPADDAEMLSVVAKFSDRIKKLAETKPEQAEALMKLAYKLDNSVFPAGVISFLRILLKGSVDEFDQRPGLFNFANGTYDLNAQQFREADRDDLLTQVAGAAYRAKAQCPEFISFLTRCFPNEEIRDYLQRWFGYCLAGHNAEKILLMIRGAGDNGKTILLEIIKMVMGAYATHVQFSSLTESEWSSGANTPKGDLVALMKARFVTADESKKHMKLDEAAIKQLTGGGTWTGRQLYCEPRTYTPIFKLMLSSNFEPKITNDPALGARIHYLPMTRKFARGNPERVENQKALLIPEREGIASWMVEGYNAYRREGLNPPAEVLNATEEYLQRSDVQLEFFTDLCETGGEIPLQDLYHAHSGWAYRRGDEAKLTFAEFEDVLLERKYKIGRRTNQRGRPKIVFGLHLRKADSADAPELTAEFQLQ